MCGISSILLLRMAAIILKIYILILEETC